MLWFSFLLRFRWKDWYDYHTWKKCQINLSAVDLVCEQIQQFLHTSFYFRIKKKSNCDTWLNTKRPSFVTSVSAFHNTSFFHPFSVFWLTEESFLASWLCSPPISTFPVYCLHQPTLCPQLLSLLFYVKLLSFWTLMLDLNVYAEGPSTRSWIPTFRAEGRISFSKCLAGKYVTRLETDPVKNRWDVFKPLPQQQCVCDLFLPSHTHSQVKSVSPPPAEILSLLWNVL